MALTDEKRVEAENRETRDGSPVDPEGYLKPDAEEPNGTSGEGSVSGDSAQAEKGVTEQPAEEPPRKVKGWVWFTVVLAILSSCFLFALDNTIVADVQPKIIERFGNIGKLPWLSVAFMLGAVGTNLIWGQVFGQFNAKWLYIGNLTLFEIGSAVCGAAPTMNALIVGRAIAGVGGVGTYIGVMTLLSINTTVKERPAYIGLTGLTWGAGTVLGPVIGGAFADSGATWRWAFYINLCVFALFAPVYLFFLPSSDPRPGVPYKQRLMELDFAGSVLIVGAFTCLVMAIGFGGNLYPWNSGRIIGLFCAAGALFILFALQQGFSFLTKPERRLFPVHFLKSRSMLILFALIACGASAAFIAIYFIPIYFQFVRNDSALKAGVRLLPFVVMLVFFCVANGAIMGMTGYHVPWYLAGGILALIGSALMYTVNENSSTSRVYGYSVLIGIGTGMYIQASFSVAQAKVPPQEVPLAIGYISCGQLSGATITLAIANTVFLNLAGKKIQHILPHVPYTQIQAAIAGASSTFIKTLPDEVRKRVLAAIVDSISTVYILAITAAALTVVLSLGLKWERLFLGAAAGGG
ncbi:MFS general substrate transporter [Xylona heveae TC161]|uniref:MFS general substrate transporter n=1 Tax=Xylona heveae (strain CBS 132557 / TC161) TaxID=1328760 RepID=A0A165GDK9_XYLHT|nr:MFS general substrate transporter [Xylona heveae TC161]KZF22064.1 MFS general substrate transporter [Xylona heveae TC161]